MDKKTLKQYIDLYESTENIICELDDKYGIRIWDSYKPNFYNNYNLLLHKLLIEIFGETNVDTLEMYIFKQIDITFDELCNILNIKDNETNNK